MANELPLFWQVVEMILNKGVYYLIEHKMVGDGAGLCVGSI